MRARDIDRLIKRARDGIPKPKTLHSDLTLTVSIAGPISTNCASWRASDASVQEIAADAGFPITHSARNERPKFTTYRRISDGESLTTLSLASFYSVDDYPLFYAVRTTHFGGAASVSVAVDRALNLPEIAKSIRAQLSHAVRDVRGAMAFLLPRQKAAANFQLGLNDVREASSATVLFYEPGGFIHP